MNSKLSGISVTIIYDKDLQEITKVKSEKVFVSNGLIFLLMLKFIFSSYPEIEKRYPPGSLGLLLNDEPPSEFDELSKGDVIKLSIPDKSKLLHYEKYS